MFSFSFAETTAVFVFLFLERRQWSHERLGVCWCRILRGRRCAAELLQVNEGRFETAFVLFWVRHSAKRVPHCARTTDPCRDFLLRKTFPENTHDNHNAERVLYLLQRGYFAVCGISLSEDGGIRYFPTKCMYHKADDEILRALKRVIVSPFAVVVRSKSKFAARPCGRAFFVKYLVAPESAFAQTALLEILSWPVFSFLQLHHC